MSIPLLDGAVSVVYPFVAHIASALTPVGGAAAAIVLCTAALRLLLLPLTLAALRGERSRAALAPPGAAPVPVGAAGCAAGCLPALVQAPLFMVAYRIFTAPHLAGQANVLLSGGLFGVPLGTQLIGGGYPLAFLPVIVVLLGLAWLAARRARRLAMANDTPVPSGPLALLPYLSVVSVFVVPLAATLYLMTTLAWTAAENALLRRGLPAG
jgi:YidC/Oxa1 family membrane protein insertase